MPLALFGINDGGLNLAVNLVILVLVVVWLSLVYWTFADARRRIGDPVLVTTATAASLIPFIGTVIYTILRPPEFLADVREREVETQASELRMRHLTAQSCPRCEHPIERSWLRCPECQHRLKDPCISCNRPVDPRWSICPYCETQLRRSSSPEEEPTRKRSRSSGREGEGSAREATQAPTKRRKPASAAQAKASAAKPAAPVTSANDPSAGTPRSERKPRSSAPASDADGEPSGSRPRRRSTTPS